MGDLYTNNAKVFKDTRKKSLTTYRSATEKLFDDTYVYDDADTLIADDELKKRDMEISVVVGGTVSTAYNLVSDYRKVAMLNFADAKRPGGWVIEGANTQEENMCRCTNLYETLVQKKCMDGYYGFNMLVGVPDKENHYIEPYADAMIYSENVTIFKDDKTYADVQPKQVDVITSPAPCGVIYNVQNILIHRMRGIVKAAYLHGVTHLVLGAWGCGAFMQDPETVATCFKQVLQEFPVFKSVVFAIRDCYGETGNYTVFKEVLTGDSK